MGVLVFNPVDRAHHPRVHLLALCLLGMMASCSPDRPIDSEFGPQDLGQADGDMGTADLGEVQATVLPTVDGVWLVMDELSTCVEFLVINEELTRHYHLVESQQDANGLVDEKWTACRIVNTPIFNMETVIPEPLLESAYPLYTVNGLVTGTRVGRSYTSGLMVGTWGADFDDPVTDPFPVDTDDPRIGDTDGDGIPGATLNVGSCKVYQVQRSYTSFRGFFTTPDRIEGQVVSLYQNLTLGSSQPLCGVTYVTWPNEAQSRFQRIRIDGQGASLNLDADDDGTITCDEVRPYLDVLFETREPDNETCEH